MKIDGNYMARKLLKLYNSIENIKQLKFISNIGQSSAMHLPRCIEDDVIHTVCGQKFWHPPLDFP